MPYPIETTGASGLTIYAVIHHPDGRMWNPLTLAWEAFNAGHWADYAVYLAEQGASGYYRAEYPDEIYGVLTSEILYSQGTLGAPSQADAPPIGVGQSQGSAVAAIEDSVVAADNLRANLGLMIQGEAVSGHLSAVQMTTDLPDTTDDVYVGRLLMFVTGGLIRRSAYITAYNGTSHMLTFGSIRGVPNVGDAFIII